VENKKLPNYILLSDFVIIPSLAEGFGFAVAEVSALEKEIITTDVAAIPEVVSGKACFIEPASSHAIVDAVVKMKNGEYQSIPKKLFLWDENIEKTLQVYAAVTSQK